MLSMPDITREFILINSVVTCKLRVKILVYEGLISIAQWQSLPKNAISSCAMATGNYRIIIREGVAKM